MSSSRRLGNRSILRMLVVIVVLLVAGLAYGFVSTRHMVNEYRARIIPGLSLAELRSFAGPPAKVFPFESREKQNSYTSFPRAPYETGDPSEAIYFYPKPGVPYVNIVVFLNRGTVTRLEVVNCWW